MALSVILGIDSKDTIESETSDSGALHFKVNGATLLFWDTDTARRFASLIVEQADFKDARELVGTKGTLVPNNPEDSNHQYHREGEQ